MSVIKPQQILMPKKVHIADTAELRCTFNSDSPKLKSLTSQGTTVLTEEIFKYPIDDDNFEIKSISISPSGINYYQLDIIFTPWKTGSLKFPNIILEDVELSIKSEEIVSLTEEYQTSSLQSSTAPLLLPGTTYKLYGSIVLGLIIIIGLVTLIIKRKKVNFYIKNKKLQKKYKKNKKRAYKALKLINNNQNLTDSEVAEQVQKVVRDYLEVRFDYPFTRSVTSELIPTFERITQSLLSEKKYIAFDEIANTFIRTDYIRYSSNAMFLANERSDLIQLIVKNIEILEGEDDA